jgi:glutamine synthetase adenylyltransferase
MTGIVSQYMDYADELQANDWERYAEIKDKVLFGVVALFVEELPPISFNSSTE